MSYKIQVIYEGIRFIELLKCYVLIQNLFGDFGAWDEDQN